MYRPPTPSELSFLLFLRLGVVTEYTLRETGTRDDRWVLHVREHFTVVEYSSDTTIVATTAHGLSENAQEVRVFIVVPIERKCVMRAIWGNLDMRYDYRGQGDRVHVAPGVRASLITSTTYSYSTS